MSDARPPCVVSGCDKPYSSKGYCKVHAERVRKNGHPGLKGQPPGRPLSERLAAKVDQSGGPDACWPFTGRLSTEGYGRIRTAGAGSPTTGAHRAAFLLANPDDEAPETVDHICHDPQVCAGGSTCPHRRCCNPAHLAGVTAAENSSAERQRCASQRTHCKHGHEWTEANTYRWTNPSGYVIRRCRACDAARHRERAELARERNEEWWSE